MSNEFSVAGRRKLPVILLADVSGSMGEDGKIAALNLAIREMLETFRAEDDLRAEIHVGVITFGGDAARLHAPLQPAATLRWEDMRASGATPMGRAIELAAALVEDREQLPRNALRPTLILVSDGQPTDDTEGPIALLTGSGRASKAERIALAIGSDADEAMLGRFVGTTGSRVFRAADAHKIKEFFRLVTMSVATRSRSVSPNDAPALQDLFDLGKF